MTNENQGVEMSPEQQADAAAITAMVEQAGDSAQVGGAAAAEAQVPQVAPDVALAGMLTVVGMAAGIVGMPRLAARWNQDACKAVADAAVPVLAKYPWGQRFLTFLTTGAGIEEINLVMVAGPLVVASAADIRADLAKPEPKQEAEPAAPADVTV